MGCQQAGVAGDDHLIWPDQHGIYESKLADGLRDPLQLSIAVRARVGDPRNEAPDKPAFHTDVDASLNFLQCTHFVETIHLFRRITRIGLDAQVENSRALFSVRRGAFAYSGDRARVS